MKRTFVLFACAFLFGVSIYGQTWVNGYYKSDGTYVQGHYKSNSNGSVYDNYSTKGNTNPYTLQQGTKNPYNSSLYNSNSYDRNSGSSYNSSGNWYNDVKVNSYFKDNGTKVESHYRTYPDNSLYNNYSTQGNYNPYTGKKGTKKIK